MKGLKKEREIIEILAVDVKRTAQGLSEACKNKDYNEILKLAKSLNKDSNIILESSECICYR